MNFIKCSIICLIVSACGAEMIKNMSKSKDYSSLVDFTMEILSSCYESELKTIGIAGDSYGIFFKRLSSKLPLIPIALIGTDVSKDVPKGLTSRQKLQLFIVIVSSSTELNNILTGIKLAHWWNHMAKYLIIDLNNNDVNYQCSNAYSYLWKAWEMDILKSLYICKNSTLEHIIYSYNPYRSNAPNPWQLDSTYRGKNNHSWSLLRRVDKTNNSICFNIDFDKTNDLGGYEISSSVKNISSAWLTYVDEIGCNNFGGYGGIFAREIFKALNATPRLIVHDTKYPGLSDSMDRDIAVDTIIGISDIVLIPRLHSIVTNYTVSYGFLEGGLSIMTQYSGHQTQLEKLISVLDKTSRLCVCIVALTTLIFFKFFLRQSFVSSVLNVLRLVGNSSLTKIPNNHAARIYLAGVFILVVTIIGIYQGQLSSILTKPKPLPNVQSIRDLVDRRYIIHINENYPRMLNDPAIINLFVTHDSYNCTKYVIENFAAACIGRQIDQIPEALRYKLHISPEVDPKSMHVYTIRENWPIEEKLNRVLAALNEADIPRLIFQKDSERTLKILRYQAEQDKIDKFKVIMLYELSFAFHFLAIGLTCSTLCFIIEIINHKASSDYC